MNTQREPRMSQYIGLLTLAAVLLIGGLLPIRRAGADINEQVARLDLNTATLDDVTRVFGEPRAYIWGEKTFTKDNLPRVYVLVYSDGFCVLMVDGGIGELRFEGPGAGYVYRGKLRVGSSLEEVLAVLGPPTKTVEGRMGMQDGVLYKDADGKKGTCFYRRADQHVRLFFEDYKVAALYVTSGRRSGDSMGGGELVKLSDQPAGPVTFPKIDRRPGPCDFHRGALGSVPKYDPQDNSPFQVDLRGYDLSGLDLRDARVALTHADFDDRTIWPAAECLPGDFDPQHIVEVGKNPGLGVRSLHQKGVTGRGVGVAIVDNPLLTDHQEYAERLRLYEETNVFSGTEAHMHGPAVASIAVGRTVGVAPEADLYYIGRWPGDLEGGTDGEPSLNFKYNAEAIERILQINEQLPADRKIRVISMSIGWSPDQKGYQEVTVAAQKARAAGMLVICSSVEEVHGFKFHGLGRDLLSNPDDFASYRPVRWGTQMYANHDRLLVPMDARTTAGPTGKDEYAFYGEGGWSWAIPYIAGMYALAAQVDPKITPERFWALAMKTGRTVRVPYEGRSFELGPILAPAQLIEAIQRGDLSDKAAVDAELARYATSSPQGQPPDKMSKDFAARIARLDIDNADHEEIVAQLGGPASYVLGNRVYDGNNLPSRYAMIYPAGVHVIVSADRIRRITIFAPGYLFRDRIQVGTTLEEVFEVLGPPRKTVENAQSAGAFRSGEDGVFCRDLDGVKGHSLYRDQSQGVILYFVDDRVYQMMLLPKG